MATILLHFCEVQCSSFVDGKEIKSFRLSSVLAFNDFADAQMPLSLSTNGVSTDGRWGGWRRGGGVGAVTL